MRVPGRSRVRMVATILTLAAMVASSGAASAKAPDRGSDHFREVYCESLVGSAGAATLFATVSDANGGDAYTAFWGGATEPYGSQPDLERDHEMATTVAYSGGVMSGSVPLVDDTFAAAGTATFSATLAPGGPAVPFEDQFRDGNRWYRQNGVVTPLSVTGSLVFPGGAVFDLAGCTAADVSLTFFGTNPNAQILRCQDRFAHCDLYFGDGVEGYVHLQLEGTSDAFIDAGLFRPDGSEIVMFGNGTSVGGTIDTTLEAFDPHTGQPLGGGSLRVTLTATGERFAYTLTAASGRTRVSGDVYDVEGSITFPGFAPHSLSNCIAADQTVKSVTTNQLGPKPSGKTPKNDLPAGAITLAAGSRTSTSTRGASPAAEVTFDCLGDLPVGHTVWYRIVGTGSPVTVDTAGSDYDTVAAVYTSPSAGTYTPLPDACVDDVALTPMGRTLQSAVSFGTTAGTTYYVQIGGFPEAVTYGNLRVAVR